jgi:hypothetical protein
MQAAWKQTEIQIEKVINNTASMYGTIKGIDRNSIQEVKSLELGYDGKDN